MAVWDGDRRRRRLATTWLVLGLSALLMVPGCGGCSKDPAEVAKEKKKKEEEEKKKEKPFTVGRLQTRPSSSRNSRSKTRTEILNTNPPCKPGHWTTASLTARANLADFAGDLEVEIGSSPGNILGLPGTPFELASYRDVRLAKGHPKLFEAAFYVPPGVSRATRVVYRLRSRRGGPSWLGPDCPMQPMHSYQYHFLVLARLPGRYSYLKRLESIAPPSDVMSGPAMQPYYRVSLIEADPKSRAELPTDALFWTSIAYVLWDDLEPGALSKAQQKALVDWLHWGGQLLVSGPDTLDTLRDSFLAPYLPGEVVGTCEMTEADFQPLRDWSAAKKKPAENVAPSPLMARPWTGVKVKEHPEAETIEDAGELFWQRRVGSGRIVLSTFRLSGPDLTAWSLWDEVFNAFLLHRQARSFSGDPDPEMGELEVTWADGADRRDPSRTSKLRYFTRQLGSRWHSALSLGEVSVADPSQDPYSADYVSYDPAVETPWSNSSSLRGTSPDPTVWDDYGPIARAAYSSVKDAAKVEVPDRKFVVGVLVIYLAVLVPINWLVFRVIGRVEWAWVAAPIIAIVCTVTVIRMARLDIGFLRARTEVAVVEIQGSYPRAHVSRYTALYTSLSTSYDVHADSPGTLVLPLPQSDFQAASGSSSDRLTYRRENGMSLSGLPVVSNSIGMIHSEQMSDLGGSLTLKRMPDGRSQLTNSTRLTLRNTGVLKRGEQGQVWTAWCGTINPETTVALNFVRRKNLDRVKSVALWTDQREDSPLTAAKATSGSLNVRRLLDMAGDLNDIAPGDIRLVATTTDEIPGITIDPPAPQVKRAAMVIAHLRYGRGKAPEADTNTVATSSAKQLHINLQ